jgi:RNA-directed DNA polymerase
MSETVELPLGGVEISMETVLARENMRAAWAAVKANAGAAGVDGKGIAESEAHLSTHWPTVREKLLRGDYQPAAVRAVDIDKPGGGTRRLGIPTVQDRLIQQALHRVLSAAFDKDMSEHRWGFRPGRSAHDAITAARGYVAEGKEWVVDIDLASFFDQVNHDRLMHRLGKRIGDKRIMTLIGRYLRAPMDVGDGRHLRRNRGTPQGGPLSPLLANLYLDVLDQELVRRGLSFVRYADDIAVFVASERAAERVLEHLTRWLHTHLDLEVNAAKKRRPPQRGDRLAGLSHPPRWTGEPRAEGYQAVQGPGARPVGCQALPDHNATARPMATLHHRMVELLRLCQLAARRPCPLGVDSPPHAQVLLAALA